MPSDSRTKCVRLPATGRIGRAMAGDETSPEAVAVLHELTEALTATGNYLTTASRLLETDADPPGIDPPQALLREVLEKSLAQFSRAADAIRRLRRAINQKAGRDT